MNVDTATRTASRPLLVTGCGRSGSRYTASALTAAGLPCTHERVFTGRDGDVTGVIGGHAESSWFAVPWMSRLQPDTLVMHQVRDPLKCIASYVGMGFFDHRPRERPLWKHYVKRAVGTPPSSQLRIIRMVERFQPDVFEPDTPARRGAMFWLCWNEWVEQQCRDLGLTYRRIRLEDIDCAVITGLINEVRGTARADADRRIATIPTDTNTRGRRSSLSWSDLGENGDAVARLARRYGYER